MKKNISSVILGLVIITVVAISSSANEDAYSDYVRLLQNRIDEMRIYPEKAQNDGLEGVVKLGLFISGDGRLKSVFLRKSSGHKLLDEAASETVVKASPYPAIPEELNLSELSVDVPIVYRRLSPVTRAQRRLPDAEHRAQGEQRTATAVVSPSASLKTSTDKPSFDFRGTQRTIFLSLDDAIEIGLTNYKPVQVALEQVRLARIKVRQARRNLYPTLAGEWKSTQGETVIDPYESLSYGLQLEQTIYDGGMLKDTLRQEDLAVEIAKRNYRKVRNDFILEISKAYYTLLRSKMLFKNQEALLGGAEQDMDLARRLYKAELTTEAEYLNIESLYRQIEFQLSSLKSELSLAKLTLIQLLDIDTKVEFKDTFERDVNGPGLSLEQCINLALSNRSEVEIGRISVESARYEEKIARRQGWPKLSMVTSYGRSGESYTADDLSLVNEWSVLTKLSWLFGGNSLEYANIGEKTRTEEIVELTRKTEATTRSLKFSLWDKDALMALSRRKEAGIVYQGSLGEVAKAKNTVRLETEKAYLGLKQTLIGINSARHRVEFRRKELAVIKARSNLEELPLSNLLQARMQLADEEANYIQSLANYYLSRVALKRATAYTIAI